MKGRLLAAIMMATSGATAAAAPVEEAEIAPFFATAQVHIDAAGSVSRVEADPALAPAVVDAMTSVIRSWKFAAPTSEGVPVSGVTTVKLAGCAAPAGDGIRLAFDYSGHGPGWRTDKLAPRYPVSAIGRMANAELKATYVVDPQGVARVEAVEMVSGARGSARAFKKAVEEWITDMAFTPEQLAGKPVATRMEQEFSFTVERAGSRTGAARQIHRKLADTDACRLALDESKEAKGQAVALDSPFRLLESAGQG